ncbi:MAG: DUF1501 domain-containing protein [SAR202 cluster bacterium]|nr:DUF1501 domain-containing protein [SAR202 cluster bacterium]
MATGNGTRKRSLVVVQLSGGNDVLNTIVPYTDGLYHDFRQSVKVEADKVIKLDDRFGFNPRLAPLKGLWDEGKMAIINGIGYPSPNRSHFRSMDIWHTAEPAKIGNDGWLGRAIRDLDPRGENVLTGVNFGKGLPRVLSCSGVPVASVGGNLETYGLFPDKQDEWLRKYALDCFSEMYGGVDGRDAVLSFLGQTGTSALRGADILRTAPSKYTSSVEYGSDPLAQSLKNVAQVMFAGFGTRIYYTQQGSYDTHADQANTHGKLITHAAAAIRDFLDDVREHGMEDEVLVFAFSEFGRRVKDNGDGTDHGSGGSAFIFGGGVKGGMYGEYPSLRLEDQLDGDLHFNNDFRSTYATILEQWLGLDSKTNLAGTFEQFDFVRK